MIHSAGPTFPPVASSDHYSHVRVILFCEILKSDVQKDGQGIPDGRTDNTCGNSDHYCWGRGGRSMYETIILKTFLVFPFYQLFTSEETGKIVYLKNAAFCNVRADKNKWYAVIRYGLVSILPLSKLVLSIAPFCATYQI